MEPLAPGYSPVPGTDEVALWRKCDEIEKGLRTSGNLLVAPELERYIENLACEVAGPHGEDLRVYIPQVGGGPFAFSLPNGTLIVTTGALLRTANEAQMAFLLAHEAAHYVARHGLQSSRAFRAGANRAAFFSAIPLLGPLGAHAEMREYLFYNREQELEADRRGLELVAAAGYDPREAPVFHEMIAAEEALQGDRPPAWAASHPPTEDRAGQLRELLPEHPRQGDEPRSGRSYRDIIAPFLLAFLMEELRLRNFGGAELIVDRLEREGGLTGELFFVRGEIHRLRRGEGEADKARAAYEEAERLGGAPPELYRSLGLLLLAQGEVRLARNNLERYLEVRPQAQDREVLRAEIEKLL